jgi:hypothetical protein
MGGIGLCANITIDREDNDLRVFQFVILPFFNPTSSPSKSYPRAALDHLGQA